WTKGLELAKLARRDGQSFESAIWLHRAREMPTEDFKREVEKELSGKEEEPWEIIYFKVYKSQIPVIEQAIDTAALMLGTDKSRGYCLDDLCGFPGGGKPGQRQSGHIVELHIPVLQIPAR